jgi:hypothetical protein
MSFDIFEALKWLVLAILDLLGWIMDAVRRWLSS